MASDLLDDMDCRKWEWLAAVARTFNPNFFVDCFPRFVGTKDVAIIFLIGKALFGYVNVRRRQIFDQNREFHPFVSSAVEAIKFYEAQLKGAKDAVDAWTIIAIRLKVVKDIRRVIASLIWGARGEAEYR
jgi:hypothetical protein